MLTAAFTTLLLFFLTCSPPHIALVKASPIPALNDGGHERQPEDAVAFTGSLRSSRDYATSRKGDRLVKRAPLPGAGASSGRHALESTAGGLNAPLLETHEHARDELLEHHEGLNFEELSDREREGEGEEVITPEEAVRRESQSKRVRLVMRQLRQLPGFSQGLGERRMKEIEEAQRHDHQEARGTGDGTYRAPSATSTAGSTFAALRQQGREFKMAEAAMPEIISQAEGNVDLQFHIDLEEEELNRLQVKYNENYGVLLELIRLRREVIFATDLSEKELAKKLRYLNADIPRKAWLVAHARQKMYERYLQLERSLQAGDW